MRLRPSIEAAGLVPGSHYRRPPDQAKSRYDERERDTQVCVNRTRVRAESGS